MDNIYAVLTSIRYEGFVSVRLYPSLEDATAAYNKRVLHSDESKYLLGPFLPGEDITASIPITSEHAR